MQLHLTGAFMAGKEKQENQIYTLSKKISLVKDEAQREKLLVKLNTILSKHFESEQTVLIEEALTKAIQDEDVDTVNLLMDEIHLEIEMLSFEDEGKEYDSVMQLMPVTLVTHGSAVQLPSIDDFEAIIAQSLVNKKIIDKPEQFHLGTIFLSQEDVDTFTLQDWWNTHRDIIEEPDSKHYEENKKIRAGRIRVPIEKSVSMFYFVPVITYEDEQYDVMERIYDSHLEVNFWRTISEGLSSEECSLTIFPPMGVAESMENSKYIMQDIEFSMFFDQFSSENEIEIGYIKVSDNEDYAVLFFDGEDNMLHQFYRYEIDGDSSDFVSMLVEKCLNAGKSLYSFEDKVDMETLTNWSETEDAIDLDKIMKNSNLIDLEESFRMCKISHPSIDDESNEQTIH